MSAGAGRGSSRRDVMAAGLRGAAGLMLAGPVVLSAACRRAGPPDGRADAGGPRIAALAPAISMIARDLGLGDCLVARHAFDAWADPALPAVLDQNGIDYAGLLRARPTHVLTQWGDRPLPDALVELSKSGGLEVHDFRFLPLDDVSAAVAKFGGLFPSVAERASAWQQRIAEALKPIPEARAAGRVLLLHTPDPPAALGPGSYHHQLLERLGATAAITEGSRFMELHAADVLRIAPDSIVLIRPRSPSAPAVTGAASDAGARMGRLADLAVPALTARPQRVALIEDTDALIPGTNLVRLAGRLGDVLRGFASARG